MKQALCVLMIVLSLSAGFQQAALVLHFRQHQAAIEQQFCINKNNPALGCHGTCHLKKQLEKTGNTDPGSAPIYQRLDMLAISVVAFAPQNKVTEIPDRRPLYRDSYYTEPLREVSVPPPIAWPALTPTTAFTV